MSSISEQKMFVEYHCIQMLNRSFHPGLVSEVCEISYKFILATSQQTLSLLGARWLSGRVSDSGARGPGFETYLRRVVSLSKTLYSPKVLVNYLGSDGSVPT